MRIGRVVGNMVSVIHDPCHTGHKFLLVRFLDIQENQLEEGVFADCANAGIGDLVLVNESGGAAELIFGLENEVCVFDGLIVGVVDE